LKDINKRTITKVYQSELERTSAEWRQLTEVRIQWPIFMSNELDLRVGWEAGNFLASCTTIICSTTVNRGVSYHCNRIVLNVLTT